MTVIAVQASFASVTGIPADALTNTWHFQGSGTDFANLEDLVYDFYNHNYGTLPLCAYMTDDALTGVVNFKMYDLEDTKPRVPVYESELNITSLNNVAALPPEVALVASFQAAGASGVNQARRRNRVFLGGLGVNANTTGRPADAFMDNVVTASVALLDAAQASVSWNWVTFSPTIAGGGDPDTGAYLVTNGWVDNAWDTQRRRGWASTERNLWNA